MVVSLMEKQDLYLIQHQISMEFGSKIDLLKCSNDQEKLLKFEVEGREFTKIWKSLEQFMKFVKGQYNF